MYGWAGALLIRGVYYWGKFAVSKGVDAYWRRRLPPAPVRSRPKFATPRDLLGAPPASPLGAAAAARVARGPDPVDQLARLADLRDRGALTDAEFSAEKARIINRG